MYTLQNQKNNTETQCKVSEKSMAESKKSKISSRVLIEIFDDINKSAAVRTETYILSIEGGILPDDIFFRKPEIKEIVWKI